MLKCGSPWWWNFCTITILLTVSTCPLINASCPVFGTDDLSRHSRSREERVFLNFEAPSQCRGNVTSWGYCNYDSAVRDEDDDEDEDFRAKFLVYRRSSSTSNTYQPVTGSTTAVVVTYSIARRFGCRTLSIDEPFEIQENDVIGACVWDDGAPEPLFLIGDTNDGNANQRLYQFDESGYDDCEPGQLASIDTTHQDFRQRDEWKLQLFANIVVATSCRAGNNPSATEPLTSSVSGTYLNTADSAACSDHITSWYYCYYTSAADVGQTYTMTVAAWSLEDDTYRVIPGSSSTISLTPVMTHAKIFCIKETLDSANYVAMAEGDVVGVVLPSSNPIPVVSTNADSSQLMKHSQSTSATDLLGSEFTTISDSALHVYANLEFVFIPTTDPPTTDPPTTDPPTTDPPTTDPPTTDLPTTDPPTTDPPTTDPPTTDPPTTDPPTTDPPTTNLPTTDPPTTDPPTTDLPTTDPSTTDPPTTDPPTTDPPTTDPPTTDPPTTDPPTTDPPTTDPLTTDPPTTDTPSTDPPTTDTPSTGPPTTDRSSSDTPTNGIVTPTGDRLVSAMPSDLTDPSGTDLMTTLGISNTGFTTGDISAVILSIVVVAVVLGSVIFFAVLFIRRQQRKANFSAGGVNNVLYGVANEMVVISSNIGPRNINTMPFEYCTPHSKEKEALDDSIYEEIDEDDGSSYYHNTSTVSDSLQDYHECLEQARQGSLPRVMEDPYHTPANSEAAIYREFKKLNICTIPSFNLEISGEIGSGQFGIVSAGIWTKSPINQVPIAAKTLHDNAPEMERVKFLQEAAIMVQFKHPNVVGFYGVSKKDDKRMMVVELLSKGDLLKFLRAMCPDPGELVQPSTPRLLLEFSQQIALGMSYLAGKGFVHRDLASRNILISENNICKITDFGMSRDLQDTDYYLSSGGKIPLRWTAPEAIHFKKYSTASDIWSYGCVLYEIWSLGTKPFEAVGNVEVIRILKAGIRLAPPPGCPKRVYDVMIQTWESVPDHRPEFREILLGLLENKSVVLMIPPEDKATHPQAGVLGAPLEAGQKMYTALQNTYTSNSS